MASEIGLDLPPPYGSESGHRRNYSGFTISNRNGGVDRLAEVRLQDGESLENALRRFKRKVQQEDIIKEIKRHSFYLKPGEKKRVKAALARKRARKKARHEQD
jgi:small subunit ribosomal protein S21